MLQLLNMTGDFRGPFWGPLVPSQTRCFEGPPGLSGPLVIWPLLDSLQWGDSLASSSVQWMTSFTRLYLECAATYTLHIISDVRHWISSWWHDHGGQQCFVHLISVEFSKYNIELVDLVDFRYPNSTQLSNDRLNRSTRSISGSSFL